MRDLVKKIATCPDEAKAKPKPKLSESVNLERAMAILKRRYRVEANYRCDQCQYSSNNWPGMSSHIEFKHQCQWCFHCGKTFSKQSLRQHIREQHPLPVKESEPYNCKMCYITSFATEIHLQRHFFRIHYRRMQPKT